MSAVLGDEIRTMHPAGFRSGKWATLVSIVEHKGRDCFLVLFSDNTSDWWVVDDPCGQYEFRFVA